MVWICFKAEIAANVHRSASFYLILSTHFLSSSRETAGSEKTKSDNQFVTNIIAVFTPAGGVGFRAEIIKSENVWAEIIQVFF